jgi:hypothetical protein
VGIGENGNDVCQRLPIVRENRPRCIKSGRSSIGQSIALARTSGI